MNPILSDYEASAQRMYSNGKAVPMPAKLFHDNDDAIFYVVVLEWTKKGSLPIDVYTGTLAAYKFPVNVPATICAISLHGFPLDQKEWVDANLANFHN